MLGAQAVPQPEPWTSLGRVLRHSTLYAFGNIAGRAVAFLAIPVYSRFLSPAEYGLIELVEPSTQTVAIAFGLQAVGTALARLFHDQASEAARNSVVSTALVGTAVLSAVVTAAGVAGAGAISRAVFHTDAGVWGFVSSKLIVSVAGAGFLPWRLRRDVGWHWRGVYVPEFIRFGAPLVVSGLSYFAVHFSDQFFLTAAVSLAELGRYALAYRFALMVNALVGDSFAKSWDVSLYRHTNEAGWREQFAQVFAYFALALCTTGLAIAVFSPELLSVMVPASFMPPALLLPVLVLAYVLRDVADFFRSLLLINKRAAWVGKIALAAAAGNLAMNMLLIPAYGTFGVAFDPADVGRLPGRLLGCRGLGAPPADPRRALCRAAGPHGRGLCHRRGAAWPWFAVAGVPRRDVGGVVRRHRWADAVLKRRA